MPCKFVAVFLTAVAFVFGLGDCTAKAAAPAKITHMVPMRDGVKLATDVYLPSPSATALPVVYSVGPYGKSGIGSFARQLVHKGYAVVSQDMRGRGESEGQVAIVFHHMGWAKNTDGHDTLRWISGQPWSNGKIATWGGSALACTQNMMAPGAPDALKAQYVLSAFSNMYPQCVYQGGVFRFELIDGWLKATKMVEGNLAAFRAHPRYDQFWSELNPEAQASRVHSPAIYVGGWYDIFLDGTIRAFQAVQEKGLAPARGNCRLVIGPIAHGHFRELKYPKSGLPPAADAVRFFEHWLLGKANGVEKEKPVHYYVMGDPTDPSAPGNHWRTADSWPPPATRTLFYLHEDGALSTQLPAEESAARTFRYDPKDPTPTKGGQNLLIPAGPMDQRPVESRSDQLLFTSAVLEKPIEATGPISARLFVSSDCPDTDFTVKLCDVYPDGRSMLVTDGVLRVRYRKSLEVEEFMEPGEVYPVEVDLWSTSLIFNKGHRIRVAVASANSPRFEANPNTGKLPRVDAETRIAINTVHLSKTRASLLCLPIVEIPAEPVEEGGQRP